jgi:2-keto-3-deoxy-galactonokinase
MTGELFALLRDHSILRHSSGRGHRRACVPRGRAGGADRFAPSALFGRGRRRCSACARRGQRDYVSGLLIGADVAAIAGREAFVLPTRRSARFTCRRHCRAGCAFHLVDSRTAFVAGMTLIRRLSA